MDNDFNALCINHVDRGGDDNGELRVDGMTHMGEDRTAFISIKDMNDGEAVAASVILSRNDIKDLRNYLNTLLVEPVPSYVNDHVSAIFHEGEGKIVAVFVAIDE